MKTLVTHIRPHLDDICALWMLKRFFPDAEHAEIEFVSTSKDGGSRHDDDVTTCVGVGRGRFDEHKGDVGDCSTTLVFKEMLRLETPEPEDQAALKRIADWVLQVDTGKLKGTPHQQFSIPAILDGYFDLHERDSLAMTMFGFDMLDALFVATKGEVAVAHAWAERTEFDTPWGRGAGLETNSRQVDGYAYERGFVIVVLVNKTGDYHTIRGNANSDVDLTAVYEELTRREPQASWYFHHSKKMLICGGTGGMAAEHASRLSLRDLIALLKKH